MGLKSGATILLPDRYHYRDTKRVPPRRTGGLCCLCDKHSIAYCRSRPKRQFISNLETRLGGSLFGCTDDGCCSLARAWVLGTFVWLCIDWHAVGLARVLDLFFIRADTNEVDPPTRDGQAKQTAKEKEAILIS